MKRKQDETNLLRRSKRLKKIEESDDEDYEESVLDSDEEYDLDDDFIDDSDCSSEKQPKNNIITRILDKLDDEYDEKNDDYDKEFDGNIEETDYYKFIKNNLSEKEREELKETINRIKINSSTDIPLKYKILTKEIDDNIKEYALKKYLEIENNVDDTSGENIKNKNLIENLLSIPTSKYIETKYDYKMLKSVEKNLNECIYGMEETKENILGYVATWINNPSFVSHPIGLVGPAGSGKTTIVREGIAKALGRPFYQINLGGLKDSSALIGHEFTYVGSRYGLIADALIKSKCMNPIIYFDELDKIPESAFAEISGVLIHLIDPAQNSSFHDRYFSGINLDLSKVTFIFSFNEQSLVDKILLDRIQTINISGYNKKEKIEIAKNFLIPQCIKNLGLKNKNIIFEDNNIEYIIDRYSDEKGVRKLKRGIINILTKLNLYNLLINNNENENYFLFKKIKNFENIKNNIKNNIINKEVIDVFLNSYKNDETHINMMYS